MQHKQENTNHATRESSTPHKLKHEEQRTVSIKYVTENKSKPKPKPQTGMLNGNTSLYNTNITHPQISKTHLITKPLLQEH